METKNTDPTLRMIELVSGWAGTVIAIYFFVAPAVPFCSVVKGKLNYKDSPAVLLFCSLMNCILWADYGLLLNNIPQYIANIIGGTVTLCWFTIFLIFLGQKNFCLGFLLILLLIGAIGGISWVFYFIIDKVITGYIVMIFNVLMYAAPLEKIVRVFRTSNYKLIPIFSSIGGALCSLCWLVYGIVINNLNTYIPNALGLFFAILQIVLYIIYYVKVKNEAEEFAKDDDVI